MALNRPAIEQQLHRAKERLNAKEAAMSDKGVEDAARRRDPGWRMLNAKCRRLRIRLQSAQAVRDLDEEVKNRRESRESGGGDDA